MQYIYVHMCMEDKNYYVFSTITFHIIFLRQGLLLNLEVTNWP